VSLFDDLTASIAVEEEYSIEDPQEAKLAFLSYLQDDTSPSAYNPQLQEAQEIATSMQRVLTLSKYTLTKRMITPEYETAIHTKDSNAPAPEVSGDTLEGYAAWWYESDGNPYIDSYDDWVAPKSWEGSIAKLREQQRKTGNEFLIPHFYQHNKYDVIGGVKHLSEDSKGVVYATKLAMKVRRAQETYDLAKIGAIGTSYGYDRLEEEKAIHPVSKKSYNKLKRLHVREISSVSYPANPYARTYAKSESSTFYVSSSYNVKNPFHALDVWAANIKEL
jgi:HK97 family phage prohead protease